MISNEKTAFIIRGLPGSGKSTLASRLARLYQFPHIEADQFFIDQSTGKYVFDARRLSKAHDWCFSHYSAIIRSETASVVVSNTFTHFWEMESYVLEASFHDYRLVIIEMVGEYGSVHNVPEETMKKMRDRFVPNEDLRRTIAGLIYKPVIYKTIG